MGEARRRGSKLDRVQQAMSDGRMKAAKAEPHPDLGTLLTIMRWRAMGVRPMATSELPAGLPMSGDMSPGIVPEVAAT